MSSSSSEARIRPMTAGDVGRAMEIAASLKGAPEWAVSAYLVAVNPESRPRRIALVADYPKMGLAGFAVACVVGQEAELETIAVTAESQRRGVGRRLMGAIAEKLREERITKVHLEVRASNLPALALYCAGGFQESGRRPGYYADPMEDAVLLSLCLE